MADRPIVFISSTSDLAEERRALLAALGPLYQPYLYEDDRARRASPEQRCREMIEGCHVFVGILGSSYGTPFPGSDPERSIVEWEFDTARARDDLEVMAFVKKTPPGAEVEPRQQRFLTRVTGFGAGLWCKMFDSTEGLVSSVRGSLEAWLVEFWGRMQSARTSSALRLHRLLLAAVAAAVAALLAVVLSPLRSLMTTTSLVVTCLAIASLPLFCLILLLAETGGRHGHPRS